MEKAVKFSNSTHKIIEEKQREIHLKEAGKVIE